MAVTKRFKDTQPSIVDGADGPVSGEQPSPRLPQEPSSGDEGITAATRVWERARKSTLKSNQYSTEEPARAESPVMVPRQPAAATRLGRRGTLRSAGARRPGRLAAVALLLVCVGGIAGAAHFWSYKARLAAARPALADLAEAAGAPAPGRASQLHLRVSVLPARASSWLDGQLLAEAGDVDRVIETPCRDGGHDLRVEAAGHRGVVKRIPCDGAVILDIALEPTR